MEVNDEFTHILTVMGAPVAINQVTTELVWIKVVVPCLYAMNECASYHARGLLLLTWFNFNYSTDKNYMPGKVWNEITNPYLNFNALYCMADKWNTRVY